MAAPRRRIAMAAALAAAALGVLLLRTRGSGDSAAQPADEAGGAVAAPTAAPVPSRLPVTVPAPALAEDGAFPARFEGRVVSRASGAGIPGAELTFAHAGVAASVRAGANGAFRFDPPAEGRWLLAAVTARGFLPFAPEWGHSPVQLDARAGHPVRGLAVHLAPADEIAGRVVDAEGRPAPGAEVRLLGVAGEAALVSIPDRFTTGEEGDFRFAAPRGAVVEARRPGFAPGRAEVDLSVVLERRITVRLGPPHAGLGEPRRIAGRVITTDGAPIAGALVVAEPERGFGFGVPAAQGATGAEGSFDLGGLDPGSYRLTARAEGHAPSSARRVPAGDRDVTIRLAEGGRLRGCVRARASGAPVAPFTVFVFARRSALFRILQRSRSFVDASGCWSFDDLRPGAAAVVISAPRFAPSAEILVEVPASGEAVADAALEGGGRLSGVVRDARSGAPLAGARLSVEGALAEAASTFPALAEGTTDAAGRFALEGLPRRLSLAVAAAGHHGRIVGGIEVPVGGEAGPIDVALRPLEAGETPRTELAGIGVGIAPRGDALAVTSVVPGSGAEEAGLARGDLVVRVDGREVAELGMAGAVDAIRGPEGSFVVLAIRRGDTTLEVRVPRRLVRG
jgi:hypothetical protein